MDEILLSRHMTRTQWLAAAGLCGELLSLGKGLGRGAREVSESCSRICGVAAEELSLNSAYQR